MKEAEQRIEVVRKRLAMPAYEAKTPEAIRRQDAESLAKLEAELAQAHEAAVEMRKLLPASGGEPQ